MVVLHSAHPQATFDVYPVILISHLNTPGINRFRKTNKDIENGLITNALFVFTVFAIAIPAAFCDIVGVNQLAIFGMRSSLIGLFSK
jgi:hypothetical protein